jgi:hypothetical protein
MKKTKGFSKYITSSGKTKFSSHLILDRKRHHIASHDCEIIAHMAHLKAAELIKTHCIEEVKRIIRQQTIPSNNFPDKYHGVHKHRNKYYFRVMIKGKKYHSRSFESQSCAYMGLIEFKLRGEQS